MKALLVHKVIRSPKSLLLILLLASGMAFPQEKEAVKQQAEKELQKSSPEQIKAKIKELGISEQEARSRAKGLGIDLQQYLDSQAAQKSSEPSSEPQTQQLQEQPLRSTTPKPSAVPQTLYAVPGFEGRSGAVGLQPYGYNIFQFPGSTFEPVLNIPTPPSYVLGPGDEVILTVWGETQLLHQLVVNREGILSVPAVGPVLAQGSTIEVIKTRLLRRMTSFYSGLRNGAPNANTWMDVSLGRLRTIQIFVLGEVNKPGGYAISSISTTFLAMYVAGGPSINGSLREVQVLRENKVISTVDFYDYILRGDKSKDIRLQDGDIVFVKTVGKRVGLVGNIIRPAIYELKQDGSLKELLALAGGLQVNAYYDRVHIERIIPFTERKFYTKNILDIDLKFETVNQLTTSDFKLENGDLISIQGINEFLQNRVTISGNVKKPGIFALKRGMTVRELIIEADSLLSDSFLDRANLIRVLPNIRRQIIPFNLKDAMNGDSTNNLTLEPEDEVTIYKEKYFLPEHTVSISGAVRRPGKYLRTDSLTVADLVVIAGGLSDDAARTGWELARIDTTKIGTYSVVSRFGTSDKYWSDSDLEQIYLKDYDHIVIPTNPKFNLQKLVDVHGYVMAPGIYAILNEGEKVSSLIKRAGGLRKGAYLEGATLVRKYKDAGLVAIDFVRALSQEESIDNATVLDGDVLDVPFKQEVVLVRGEVFVPSAVVYKKGASLSYYVKQAGGYREEADAGRTVVSLPNGLKWEEGWFIFPDPEILGGSTIMVPRKIEKEDKTLPILRDMVTVIASLAAITVALVQVTK